MGKMAQITASNH